MSKFAQSYVSILYDVLQQPVILCDKDNILAVEGISKGVYEGAVVSPYIESVLSKRQMVEQIEPAPLEFKMNHPIDTNGYAIVPININGDIIGAFIMLLQKPTALRPKMAILQAFVSLLILQLE